MPEPMGIMEKSATIMNYDLGGESIEGFGGRALQRNYKFSCTLDFGRMGGTDFHPGKRGDGELMMNLRVGSEKR